MQHNEQELIEENKKLREEITRLNRALKENIYENLFHVSPDIIIQVDPSYKIIVIHIPEIPRERLTALHGENLFSVAPLVVHDQMRQALEKVFKQGETIHYESEAEVLGKYRHYLNYLTPIKNEMGVTSSAYFISREITEQKNSEKLRNESDNKLMALFGSSQHLHILMNTNQKLLWFNQKATETALFLFEKELEVGKSMLDYLQGEYQDTFVRYFQKAMSGESVVFPRHYVIENDQHFYLEMMLQCIYEDEAKTRMIGISLVGVETTDRRANEVKLEKINKELIQHNQQLNQYSFVISHNLRGPIVTLLGLVNLFEQELTDEAFKNEIIQHIKKTTLHLDNIILDLNMILSQSDGRENIRSEISLSNELQMVKDLLKSQIDFAQAEIQADFQEVKNLYSVRSYIQSIFMNLVSNSIKYKKPTTPAVIRLSSHIESQSTIRIDIEDNGIGLNLEKHNDALYGFYKRFHTHVDGKGLGLHLVKTQVDLLGGKIEVKSKVNEGTTFSIYLPIR
ncbi:MAG: PAS domain-containing protein [Cytophagaceae bacterium]|nr:PAS domain-containing protein [Cytophagaceae bacterium]